MTGDIIAEHFGVQFETLSELNIDEPPGCRYDLVLRAMNLIRRKAEGHDVVIVVTHHGTTVALPMVFSEQLLGKVVEPDRAADYSHAHILDCETGELIQNFH